MNDLFNVWLLESDEPDWSGNRYVLERAGVTGGDIRTMVLGCNPIRDVSVILANLMPMGLKDASHEATCLAEEHQCLFQPYLIQ